MNVPCAILRTAFYILTILLFLGDSYYVIKLSYVLRGSFQLEITPCPVIVKA